MAKTKDDWDNYIIRALTGALLAGAGIFLVHGGMSLMAPPKSTKKNGSLDDIF
jgi:hypothetical protein